MLGLGHLGVIAPRETWPYLKSAACGRCRHPRATVRSRRTLLCPPEMMLPRHDPLCVPCRHSAVPLLPFEDHAYALSVLLREGRFGSGLPNAFEIGSWLILAAGLRDVSIVTEGLDDQDMYCRNSYERNRGLVASRIATELTRVLFVWGATELAMPYALKGSSRGESPPKQMSRFVGAGSPSLLHHDCAAENLLAILEKDGSKPFAMSAAKARKFDAPLISQGTFAAYQVRNALAHGSVEWPDGSEDSIARGAQVGRRACHVLIFAVQYMMLKLVDPMAKTLIWSEDDGQSQMALLKDVLLELHLKATDETDL